MGKGVKKVHLDFDWRDKTMDKEGYCELWKGYLLEPIKCFLCDRTGKNTKGKECPLCGGRKKVYPISSWDENKEGFQISIMRGTSYESWLAMIKAKELFNIVEEDFVKNKNIESNNSQQPKDTLVKQGGVAKADELQVDSDNGSPADTFSKNEVKKDE